MAKAYADAEGGFCKPTLVKRTSAVHGGLAWVPSLERGTMGLSFRTNTCVIGQLIDGRSRGDRCICDS